MAGHGDEDPLSTFEALLAQRHSCRGFLPEPVPRVVIERLLAAAQRSASWCNAQPWQVHVVGGAALQSLRDDLMCRARSGAGTAPELDWPRSYTGDYLAGVAIAA